MGNAINTSSRISSSKQASKEKHLICREAVQSIRNHSQPFNEKEGTKLEITEIVSKMAGNLTKQSTSDQVFTEEDRNQKKNRTTLPLKTKDQEQTTQESAERPQVTNTTSQVPNQPLENRKRLLRLQAFNFEDGVDKAVPIKKLADIQGYQPNQVCCTVPNSNPDVTNLVPFLEPTLSGSSIVKRRRLFDLPTN